MLQSPLSSACGNSYIASSVLKDLIKVGSDVNDEAGPRETPMFLILQSTLIYDHPMPSRHDVSARPAPDYDVGSWSETRSRLYEKAQVLEEAGLERGLSIRAIL
jgi:hypothetical protein